MSIWYLLHSLMSIPHMDLSITASIHTDNLRYETHSLSVYTICGLLHKQLILLFLPLNIFLYNNPQIYLKNVYPKWYKKDGSSLYYQIHCCYKILKTVYTKLLSPVISECCSSFFNGVICGFHGGVFIGGNLGRSTIRSFIFLPQVILTSSPLIVFVFWGFSPPAGDAADDDDEEEGDEGEPDDEAEDKVGAEEVLTPITLTQDDLC